MERGIRIIHLLLLAAAGLVVVDSQLKISAFNIQVFGRTKVAKTEVVDVLKQVRAAVFRLSTSPANPSPASPAN